MEQKGLARAVGALRAELHSIGLSGARIVIEVSPEQWHTIRQKQARAGLPSKVDEIVLTSDVVAGDVVVRPAPADDVVRTAEQLADLGLQTTPKTEANRLEALERQVRHMFDRQLGWRDQVERRLEDLEKRLTNLSVDFGKLEPEVSEARADFRQLGDRLDAMKVEIEHADRKASR